LPPLELGVFSDPALADSDSITFIERNTYLDVIPTQNHILKLRTPNLSNRLSLRSINRERQYSHTKYGPEFLCYMRFLNIYIVTAGLKRFINDE
jgi:hypothetical protein